MSVRKRVKRTLNFGFLPHRTYRTSSLVGTRPGDQNGSRNLLSIHRSSDPRATARARAVALITRRRGRRRSSRFGVMASADEVDEEKEKRSPVENL